MAIASAVAYPVALAAIVMAFRYVGEQWWVTLVAMYLPRIGFALPLPLVAMAAWLWGPRWSLALQLLSVWLLLFPLMGLNLGTGRLSDRPSDRVVRVLTHNISYGNRGLAGVVSQAHGYGPDVVLLQAVGPGLHHDLVAAFEGWSTRFDGEFFVATRFPIREVWVPPAIVYATRTGSAHFVRYTLETPLGVVNVFSTHPTSPRDGVEELRGNGVGEELLSGRLLTGGRSGPVAFNAHRRQRQIDGLAAAARASSYPVIIAGDTNLPDLSWLLEERLGHFRDAFRQAGRGFGYTYPAKRPWMRLDRILTDHRLRAIDFRVGEAVVAEHRCAFAIICAD